MNWLWSQVFQGSVKNVFAVSVPSLTLAGTVPSYDITVRNESDDCVAGG